MNPKRSWTCAEFRNALKTKFLCLLASEEGISEREVRGHIGALSMQQLTDIYFDVHTRVSAEPDETVSLAAVMDEIDVKDLLPKLAAVAAKRRKQA